MSNSLFVVVNGKRLERNSYGHLLGGVMGDKIISEGFGYRGGSDTRLYPHPPSTIAKSLIVFPVSDTTAERFETISKNFRRLIETGRNPFEFTNSVGDTDVIFEDYISEKSNATRPRKKTRVNCITSFKYAAHLAGVNLERLIPEWQTVTQANHLVSRFNALSERSHTARHFYRTHEKPKYNRNIVIEYLTMPTDYQAIMVTCTPQQEKGWEPSLQDLGNYFLEHGDFASFGEMIDRFQDTEPFDRAPEDPDPYIKEEFSALESALV